MVIDLGHSRSGDNTISAAVFEEDSPTTRCCGPFRSRRRTAPVRDTAGLAPRGVAVYAKLPNLLP